MPELTTAELAALDSREYRFEVKERIRDDEAWLELLAPELIDRTRWALINMIASIDDQKKRVAAAGPTDLLWLTRVNTLRRYTKARLDRMPPGPTLTLSNRKEARAWRAFSATLARLLIEHAPEALQGIEAPYDGLGVAEWLSLRDEKKGISE